MNKYKCFLLALLIVIFSFALFTNTYATVGGETYISDLAYSKVENSVYYVMYDHGGRGCEPVIRKINLDTKQISEVTKCGQFEGLNGDRSNVLDDFNIEKNAIYNGLTLIDQINLKNNNIEIKVDYLSQEKVVDWISGYKFKAHVLQDGRELTSIDFGTCKIDQENLFEGYAVPGTNKLVILQSNKRNCFEGGYITESLHVVNNIKYYDVNSYGHKSGPMASTRDSGDIVVSYSLNNPNVLVEDNIDEMRDDIVKGDLVETTPSRTNNDYRNQMMNTESNQNSQIILVSLIVMGGIVLGYVLGKRA